jgi:hypothetical protein
MNKSLVFLIGFLLVLDACAPKVTTSVSKKYPMLDYREEVSVFGLHDSIPANTEIFGTVKVGNSGFSTDCSLETVIDKAKIAARKVGGNAIKITKHSPPSVWRNSCHKIKVYILKVDSLDYYMAKTVDSTLINADYALLHIYRQSGAETSVSYDLHLGDSVICRVNHEWKTTVKINKNGLDTLWARTEKKVELPINIQPGKEYYVRCGITLGRFKGQPKLELINNPIGKIDFQSVPEKKK